MTRISSRLAICSSGRIPDSLSGREFATVVSALFIFPLCVHFVFLTLAAQYESWFLPCGADEGDFHMFMRL
jgi:hypothetical protein